MRILLALVFVAFFPGLCGAADGGASRTGQENPCDDSVIFDEPSLRGSDVVRLEHLATPTREERRLVWHCGTPDPPSPPVAALNATVRGAVTLRAPRVG